jgi:hypothetical protein
VPCPFSSHRVLPRWVANRVARCPGRSHDLRSGPSALTWRPSLAAARTVLTRPTRPKTERASRHLPGGRATIPSGPVSKPAKRLRDPPGPGRASAAAGAVLEGTVASRCSRSAGPMHVPGLTAEIVETPTHLPPGKQRDDFPRTLIGTLGASDTERARPAIKDASEISLASRSAPSSSSTRLPNFAELCGRHT